jgi:hypothetical protein
MNLSYDSLEYEQYLEAIHATESLPISGEKSLICRRETRPTKRNEFEAWLCDSPEKSIESHADEFGERERMDGITRGTSLIAPRIHKESKNAMTDGR